MALKLMEEEEGSSPMLDAFRKRLVSMKVNIREATKLFRDTEFTSVLEYFKRRIFLEKKMPALIGVLNIRPSEKYVMIPMIRGFIFTLHNQELELRSWDLETYPVSGATTSVARQIKENGIDYEESMLQVNQIYEKLLKTQPKIGKRSKYSNISYTYRNKLLKFFKELLKTPLEREHCKRLK